MEKKSEEHTERKRCEICGELITEARPDKVYSNLWVGLGEYMIKIDITKAGMVTQFCRRCRKKLVTDALSRENPYFGLILDGDSPATEARKRKERALYRFDADGC